VGDGAPEAPGPVEVSDQDPVGSLQRWEAFGAVWRVLDRDPGRVTIGLFRCDGGEEAGRFSSDDPDLLAYLEDRPSGST
jgi:hypothetical protein